MRTPTRWTILLLPFLLVMWGGCGSPSLETMLMSENASDREAALKIIPSLSPDKKEELAQKLGDHLNSGDSQILERALDGMVTLGPPSLPPLQKAMENEDPMVRLLAAEGLARLTGSSGLPLDRLLIQLNDPHPLVREEGAIGLGEMGPKANSAVPDLAKKLQDKDPFVQEAVRTALEKIGTPEAISALRNSTRPPPSSS